MRWLKVACFIVFLRFKKTVHRNPSQCKRNYMLKQGRIFLTVCCKIMCFAFVCGLALNSNHRGKFFSLSIFWPENLTRIRQHYSRLLVGRGYMTWRRKEETKELQHKLVLFSDSNRYISSEDPCYVSNVCLSPI
jgi:hypothetical protein